MNWKSASIAVAVASSLSFVGGRYSRPAKTVTVDVVKTEVQTRDVVKVQQIHDVQVVHDTATQVRTVTVTRWAKAPDGTPVVTQETHQEADRQTQRTSNETEKQNVEAQHDGRQVIQETRTVTVTAERPQWAVTALAGASLGSQPRLVPGLPVPLVAGVVLERRILGPVSGGLWATSGGAGGVSVRLEW